MLPFMLPCILPSAKAKLADSLRQLEGSKAIEDALQSELNTTLAAYAQSKEGNQKLIQVFRIRKQETVSSLGSCLCFFSRQGEDRDHAVAFCRIQVRVG